MIVIILERFLLFLFFSSFLRGKIPPISTQMDMKKLTEKMTKFVLNLLIFDEMIAIIMIVILWGKCNLDDFNHDFNFFFFSRN